MAVKRNGKGKASDRPVGIIDANKLEQMCADAPNQRAEMRPFDAWLDRALPRLQEQLAASDDIVVTVPQNRRKH